VLRKIWNSWMKFGRWMGDNITRLFLVIFYFSIVLPFGMLVRFTQDPLDIKNKFGAGWVTKENNNDTLPDARRLF
jgi:hypothetical protein